MKSKNKTKKSTKGGLYAKNSPSKSQGKSDRSTSVSSASHQDKFFRQAVSEPSLVRELVEFIFTPEELKFFNLKNIKVEEKLSEAQKMDLILSFELKKTIEKTKLPILILIQIIAEHNKAHRRIEGYEHLLNCQLILYSEIEWPLSIIPVVFYDGETGWEHKISYQDVCLKDFFEHPDSHDLKKNIVDYKPILRNINDIKNKRLRELFKNRISDLKQRMES